MSDGGAQVIVEVVSGVVQFKVGRVMLWLAAAWLTLTTLTSHSGNDAGWFFVALVLAVVALVAGFIADRKKRAERAAFRSALMLVGFTLATVLGGLWLAFRSKKEVDGPPPSEAEVDALAREGVS